MLSAAGSQGCAGAALLGQGFRVGMLADLVGDRLATARRETVRVDKRKITNRSHPHHGRWPAGDQGLTDLLVGCAPRYGCAPRGVQANPPDVR
jgi:hypothetical protein